MNLKSKRELPLVALAAISIGGAVYAGFILTSNIVSVPVNYTLDLYVSGNYNVGFNLAAILKDGANPIAGATVHFAWSTIGAPNSFVDIGAAITDSSGIAYHTGAPPGAPVNHWFMATYSVP